MGLFLSAAESWAKLLQVSYILTIGRKGRAKELPLYFRCGDFDHLSGLHYAKDIDFGVHWKEYKGDKLIGALLSGKLNDSLIEKSCDWPKISDRLTAIIHLEEFLDSQFTIYEFSANKLNFHSRIKSDFLLYNEERGDGVFLFVDKDDTENANGFYCKSIFQKSKSDYSFNQSRWTVLKKVRKDGAGESLVYLHSTYKELKAQIVGKPIDNH